MIHQSEQRQALRLAQFKEEMDRERESERIRLAGQFAQWDRAWIQDLSRTNRVVNGLYRTVTESASMIPQVIPASYQRGGERQ